MNVNKKIAKKVVAGSLAVVMTAGLVGAYSNYQSGLERVHAAQEQEAEDLTKVAENVIADKEDPTAEKVAEAAKEESVYVKADSTGKATKTTITEWLKNIEKGTVEDTTDLKDIKNVKGDEEFTQSGDGTIKWTSEGDDIYYQGTTDKELPVGVSVSYKLNGREVSAEELKGKNGKVEITFNYENKSKQNVNVKGKSVEMYTPFTMVTAMMLPSDTYKNVSVENGKLISDGERDIVVGVAFPGLEENLNLKNTDLDIDIPTSVTITADVTDASVGPTITMASADIMNEFNLDKVDSFDDLGDSIADLKDATNKLVDGSQAAADGAKQLSDGANTLADGAGKLSTGAGSLSDGADKLANGAGTLADGSKQVSDGVNELNSKSGELVGGVNKLATGVGEYAGGVEELYSGSGALLSGIKQLSDGANQLNAGITQAKAGADQLAAGMSKAKENADALAAGASGVETNLNKVGAGLGQLANGLAVINKDNILQNVTVTGATGKVDISQGEIEDILSSYEGLTEDEKAAIANAVVAAVNNKPVTVENATPELTPQGEQIVGAASVVGQGLTETQSTLSAIGQGAGTVSEGVGALAAALGQGDQTLGSGAAALAAALGEGDKTLGSGAKALVAGIGTENEEKTVLGGAAALNAGAKELNDNSAPLLAGIGKLQSSTPELVDGVSKLAVGANKVSAGAKDLSDGSNTLATGAKDLANGSVTLSDGTKTLADGAGTLADGNQTLADGMLQYKEEAIDKLTNLFDGDLSEVTDRLDAMSTLAKNYKSFAGIKDGMTGTTKFIIETEGVDD